jgi:HEAT repeat protein
MGFTAFDEHLATPFPVDHWEDDAITHAHEIVAGLTPADWAALDEAWAHRPPSWQARAAQVLSRGAPGYALPILVRMAASADGDVAEAAADSLRDFGSPEAPLVVPAALLERLERLAVERPGPVAMVLADLRRRVRAG